jgi:hypothetical protein
LDFLVTREDDHLLVTASGAPSEKEGAAMLSELLAQSRAHGVNGALVQGRMAFALDPASTKSLVARLPQLGFPANFRIAILLLDDITRVSAELAESEAVNRGIALRVFRDRAEACAWLRA